MDKRIGVIVGSLRKESFNRKMAKAIIAMKPKGLDLQMIEIGDLQLYNEDLDKARAPVEWTEFREQVREMDAILFITPEYNRSVPGVLKNALDVGSRPYGSSVWEKKPAAIISVSPGAMGGFGANHHLRQSLVFLDMPTLQQPEVYIGHADKLFGENGKLTSDKTQELLEKFISTFTEFIANNSGDAQAEIKRQDPRKSKNSTTGNPSHLI